MNKSEMDKMQDHSKLIKRCARLISENLQLQEKHQCDLVEIEKLNEELRAANKVLKDCWNKLDCHVGNCYHKTRKVNGDSCSAHRGMLETIYKISEIMKGEK